MRRLFVFLFIISTACSQNSGSGCPGTETLSSTNQKVILSEPGTVTRMSSEIPEGTELTVVVDHQCSSSVSSLSNQFPEGQGIKSHTWKLSAHTRLKDLEQIAGEDECVVQVGGSPVIEAFDEDTQPVVEDPKAATQDHLAQTKALKAAALFFDSSKGIKQDTVIAIIDTGVDLDHEDLRENIWINKDEIPGNGRDDDQNGYIDDSNGYNFASKIGNARPEAGRYHGTHVAGLAAARLGNGKGGAGVMGRRLKIMSLNVFGKNTGALTSNIDNAIRYAADNGAAVINLSLGGRGSASTTESAIKYAVSKNVTVLAAAGNENKMLDKTYFMTPGSYGPRISGMMAVGSIDTKTETRSVFSNYSPLVVEIAAPGSVSSKEKVGLYSTLLEGKYGRAQGTSMASPVAAGVAALAAGLLKSRGVAPKAPLVERLLWESGMELKGIKGIFKGRSVDAEKLFRLIDANYPMKEKVEELPEEPGLPPPAASGVCT